MKRILADIPRHVVISTSVLVFCVIAFVVIQIFLGGALDKTQISNQHMAAELAQVSKSLTQAQADVKYVSENADKYEALLKSDRLVPHTRRAAILELQNVAKKSGLSSLSYTFAAAPQNSAAAATAQPASGGYKVSVEAIDLKVGAPIDGAVYRFVDNINASFPGSAVIEGLTVSRAPEITTAALTAISKGQESNLVQGEIRLLWRTAEAEEKKEGALKK